jgi:hypothetical protein
MKNLFNLLNENGFVSYPDNTDEDCIGDGTYFHNCSEKGEFILDFLNERNFNVEIRDNPSSVNTYTKSCTWYEYKHQNYPDKIRVIVVIQASNKIEIRYVVIDYEK